MANNKDFKLKNGIQPTVYHEGLGTVVSGSEAYNVAALSYDSVTYDPSSQDTNPSDFAFNNDGTKLYISGYTTDSLYQYSLSTAYDITTASYDSVSFSFVSTAASPSSFEIKPDGTKLYATDTVSDAIYQYSLSTAWDASTLSYDSVNLSVSGQMTNPTSIIFKPDGTKAYVVGSNNDILYQYGLSTAWDLSTASYDNVSLALTSGSQGLTFNDDGTRMFVSDITADVIYGYDLSTAYDITTASLSQTSPSVAGQVGNPRGLKFISSGNKLILVGVTGSVGLFQYSTSLTTATLDLSTGSVFEITPTSDIQIGLSNPAASGTVSQATLLLNGNSLLDFANASYDSVSFSVSSQDTSPLDVFLKGDGTKMYIVGNGNDSVFQYSLSTAWDLSTASYDSVSFSVASQDTIPFGLFFKPDGFKMYICGWGNDSIYEYVLSTAWDISTASYNSVSLNVSTQDPRPSAIHFKPDGTKLYLCGDEYNAVYQYSLSTAWDLSTASYDSVSFSVGSQDGEPKGLAFTSSGEDMFIAGDITGDIYHYTLSTAFDISTSSYVDSLSHSSQASSPVGIAIKQGSDKMYIIDVNGVAVYQYTIGTGITITYDPDLQWSGGTAPTSPAIGETDVITINTDDGGTTYKAVQAIDGAS